MGHPRRPVQLSRSADQGVGPGSAPAGTIIGRRPGALGGRAVVGGLLVAAAAVVVFAAALSASGGHSAAYAVAARPLPAGTVIGPGDVGLSQMTLSGATRADAFRSPDVLVGRRVSVAVGPGELIQSAVLGSGGPSDRRPVSIPVDPDSLASVAAGDPVDVLETAGAGSTASAGTTGASGASGGGLGASGPAGAGSGSGSGSGSGLTGPIVVLRGATLSGVSRPDSGLLSGASNGSVIVTLDVSNLGQAEAVVQAAHSGTIELIRAEPSDGTGTGP